MNLIPIPRNPNSSDLNENSIPTFHEDKKAVHEKEKIHRFTRSNAALSRKIILDNHESGVRERPKNIKLTKSQPKSHEKIYVGGKMFACKFCEKRFTTSQHVKYHELIHTGEKPHACKYCEKNFSHPNSVKRHELIHTGEKPYSCKTCAYRCRQKTNLKRHEKSKKHIFMDGKTPKK